MITLCPIGYDKRDSATFGVTITLEYLMSEAKDKEVAVALLRWDMAAVTWFVFITKTREFGLPYFWISIGNLLAVVTLQYVAKSPRPIDWSHRLRQLQDHRGIDHDTGGFPCIDCHMTVVVLLPTILQTQSMVLQSIYVILGLYIALCKLLRGTRFISQVLGSWLLGFTGILIGNRGHVVIKSYKLPHGYNIAGIITLIVLLMLVIGTWIENNESSLMGIPKQDFLDVVTNILEAASSTSTRGSNISPAGQQVKVLAHQQRRQALDLEDEIEKKRDSFHFLMRQMRARSLNTKTIS